ncbi:hypothetical protein I5L81_11685 [Pseudomonas aeruginosa]|uniref:hypothetical protein n=1 Tax=Pseudomonas aeruginosa TaxID=287 RepID=UPI001068BF23|nr:hypothetical protein [Pseudomonas aeruginosa]MBG3991780.1 hypothetical protein [Pseudomonas aeruginosa]MBG4289479.1 hypothetical protein [Pseudomonas aeruginosa]MBH3591799.1 hypothetical protein [Pseudomonas aeruginosa]MBH3647572.1 hypothetical protein [Pseudomonas aeruginosa]MBH3696613.1 hypothetical protein [Pseudomonas aeruginosa]
MSIDWNTAPEGATHWEPRGIVFGEGWMKKAGNEWSYWLEGSEVWAGVWADCFVSAEREATFEARPQEAWDGQGLPPVGIEAEVIWDGADIAYFRAKILAHDEDRVVFRWCEGESKGQYGSYAVLKFGSLPAFRPLRTPEQIAAEEREKAVGDMAMSIQGVPYQYPTLYALYDAGYRRQESST